MNGAVSSMLYHVDNIRVQYVKITKIQKELADFSSDTVEESFFVSETNKTRLYVESAMIFLETILSYRAISVLLSIFGIPSNYVIIILTFFISLILSFIIIRGAISIIGIGVKDNNKGKILFGFILSLVFAIINIAMHYLDNDFKDYRLIAVSVVSFLVNPLGALALITRYKDISGYSHINLYSHKKYAALLKQKEKLEKSCMREYTSIRKYVSDTNDIENSIANTDCNNDYKQVLLKECASGLCQTPTDSNFYKWWVSYFHP